MNRAGEPGRRTRLRQGKNLNDIIGQAQWRIKCRRGGLKSAVSERHDEPWLAAK
jgi:hypothetical protein